MNILRRIILLALVVLPFMSVAQSPALDTLMRRFDEYRKSGLQEKLYVHTGQDFYLTGETMWFKVYAVDAVLNKPVSLSKVAYVELLDANKKSVVQGKIKLDKSGGHGSFFIPATLLSGNYVMRAYTQWMKNFSQDFYFQKNITIVNPFITPETMDKKQLVKTVVQFFPEGGNLVDGLRSKVAFKITGADDQIRGAIIRGGSDTVATFTPFKFGLGHFYFEPHADEKYVCVLKDPQGNATTHQLPKIEPQGYTMHVSDSLAGKLLVQVSTKKLEQPYVYLFVHARNMIVHAEVKLASPSATFAIDSKKLPEGMAHLTIFNSNLEPVCERLYFTPVTSVMTVDAKGVNPSYLARSKVSIGLTSSLKSNGVPANLSIGVYRLDSLTSAPSSGIAPYLKLTSDLVGHVESPEYYFSNDAGVKEALENLLLTHGWRRFEWKAIIKKSYKFEHAPELRSHIVKGTLRDEGGKPVQNALAYLSSPSRLVNLYSAKSDKNGNVYFEVTDFWGARKLIAQLNNRVDSTSHMSIEDPFDSEVGGVTIPPFSISQNVEYDLKLRSVAMQVQDIYYRDFNDKFVDKPKSDSTSFFGKADKTYLLDDYTRFPLLEEVLREYVPDVFVRKRKDGFHFMIVNSLRNKVFEDDPLVLLDGVPVFDFNKLMQFDPRLVRKLEVVTRYFYLGPVRINGMMSLSTYAGNLQGFELDPKSVAMDYEGLQLHRQFYSPEYENAKQRNSKMPDQRTFLYWNPELKTDVKGNVTVEFYTSDVSGKYIAVVEGITSNGEAGTGMVTFQVNNQEF